MSTDNLDTRPTIETVLERIGELKQGMTSLTSEVSSLRSDMNKGLARLDRHFDKLAGHLLRGQTRQDEIEDRLDTLDEKVS